MDINGLLTFAGLIVAAYSLLSPVQRRELSLRLNWVDWMVVLLSIVGIHYLMFYDSDPLAIQKAFSLGWEARQRGEYAYWVLFAGTMFVWLRIRFFALQGADIGKLYSLAEELLNAGKYSELASLMDYHFDRLVKIHKAKEWKVQAKRIIEVAVLPDKHIKRYMLWPNKKSLLGNKLRSYLYPRLKPIIRRLPDESAATLAVEELFTYVFLRKPFAIEISKVHPYFALKLFSLPNVRTEMFLEAYFEALLQNKHSILYFEIRNCQTLAPGPVHRYLVETSNKLLFSSLSNLQIAQDIKIYRLLSEPILSKLTWLHKHPEEDDYNSEPENTDELILESEIALAIRFFDIMVLEAINQDYEWHMWLYYFRHFTDGICKNYRPVAKYVDLEAEFPTKYSYLLYEIISTLCGWVRTIEDLPAAQKNTVLKNLRPDTENGNPIKCSILCLAQCLRTVLITASIPKKFKDYLTGCVVNLYFDLAKNQKCEKYAEVLFNSLNTPRLYDQSYDSVYFGHLISGIINNDNIPHMFGEGHERVEAFVKHFGRKYLDEYGPAELEQYVPVVKNDAQIFVEGQGRSPRGYLISP